MPAVIAKRYYNTDLIATTPGFHIVTLPVWATGVLYSVGQGVTFKALTYKVYLTCKTTHVSTGISPLLADVSYWNIGYYAIVDGAYDPTLYTILYRSGKITLPAGDIWVPFSSTLPIGTVYTMRPPLKGLTINNDTIDAWPYWLETDDILAGFRISFLEAVTTEFLIIQER